MKNLKIKLAVLFGMIALALGFLFCFNFVSVNAETTDNVEQPETTEVTEQPEETPGEEADEETKEVVDLFIDRLSKLSWKDAEAIIGWLIAYIVLNGGIIASFAIAFLIKKTKEIQQSEVYKKAIAKLDAEHQKQVEDLIAGFNAKLEDLKTTIDNNNAEHQKELKEAQNEQTKEISQSLGNILNSINKE